MITSRIIESFEGEIRGISINGMTISLDWEAVSYLNGCIVILA